jgi:hypothetical protein
MLGDFLPILDLDAGYLPFAYTCMASKLVTELL